MKANSMFVMTLAAILFAACSDDDTPTPTTPDTTPGTEETTQTTTETLTPTERRVSGRWTTGTTVELDRHLVVPKGDTLIIEPGVDIIVSSQGVGANHVPVEVVVEGCLFARGTQAQPVRFTVAPELRTEENAFKGLWGGIVCRETCGALVLDHAVVEYTGGEVVEGSPAATDAIYTAGGDSYPQLTTTNINGQYVITHSTLRRGASDGVYLMGGKAIIADNTFEANGFTGAEAINVKAGVQADVAGNILFSPNTNGLKISSAGQSETRPQCRVNAYNNTIVGAGWRRDGEKGGCIYVEKNALVNVVNNLMANCRFRAMTPKYTDPGKTDAGYDPRSVIDYNFYAAGPQSDPLMGSSVEGYNKDNKNYNPAIDQHSLISRPDQLLDPLFTAFPFATLPLTTFTLAATYDFSLQAASPALKGADGSLTPFFAGGLTVGGTRYASPSVKQWFGAKGTTL